MCDKCLAIELTIARYQRLKRQITDQQKIEGAERLLAKLEAEKLVLYPKE